MDNSFHKLIGVLFVSVSFVLGVSVGHAQVSFDPARNFDSGDGVQSIVSRDFNGDGLIDLATSNKKTDTVSVHLNGGGGTFLTPWNEYHVGPFPAPTAVDKKPKSGPIGVASADFDGDGDNDLVVSNSDADTVSVLLNFGDGTFMSATDYTVRTDGISPTPGNPEKYFLLNPEAVTTCDINGDPFQDIVAANNGGSRVSILLGDGQGRFALPTQVFVGAQPISVICGDFDKNGAQDIVTANNGPAVVLDPVITGLRNLVYTVSVLNNLGDGSVFNQVRYKVGHNPVQVIAADLDGNTWLDLITANHAVTGGLVPVPNPSWVSVLMNGADGFESEIQVGTNQFPNSVAAADLDKDGRLDLFTADNFTGGGVSVMWQNPDGTFQPYQTLSTGALNAPTFVLADTFTNLSLDVDILAHANNSNAFALLQNQLTANPLPPVTLPPTGGIPDLTVSIDKLKADFKNGETKFELQVLVNNVGGGTAEGWFVVTASLMDAIGNDILADAAGNPFAWNMFSGLQASTSQVLKYKAPAPISGSIAGLKLTITADPGNVNIVESDEMNNTASQIIN